ncbi:MAG: hypothetical protein R3Y23_01455 [Bacillota bacterium]
MYNRIWVKLLLVLVVVSTVASIMFACTPYDSVDASDYGINDDDSNQLNKDFTERDEAIEATCDSMQNLMDHLDSTSVSDTGYYVGANITINTDQDTAFTLILEANLYTYPYEMTDANGNVLVDANGDTIIDEEALAIHNNLIKQNDIVIEWYDGMTNEILIGFYFDGVNANSADPGNNLYLNIQGTKRYFTDFGDTVLYQQIVRLITQFDLSSMLGDDDATSTTGAKYDSAAVQTIYELLDLTVTDYKKVVNDDDPSYYYPQIPLSTETDTITEYLQDFFLPFDDKIDPLTKEYLGFSFWTMGHTEINTMTTNMQFLIEPASTETGGVDILGGIVIDVWGTATVEDNPDSDYNVSGTVGYETRIAITYSVRTSSDIVIDKTDYILYEEGCYEFIGEMWIPLLNLETDALIRTDVNEYDNSTNNIFAEFRDIADDSLLIGTYYTNELTYLDVEGLQGLYGGVQIEDIGLPKAYYEGIDVAELLALLSDTIDTYIVLMVDELLSPSDGSSYDNLTEAIMENVWSTEKTDADPTSRNTVTFMIDIELIRLIMQETDENGTVYSNEQMIDIIEDLLGVDLTSLAAILGMDVSELMDTSYMTICLDVDDNSLTFCVYSTSGNVEGTLLIQLVLYPIKIGEKVYMVFPEFDDYNPLQDIMTYSATIEGEFVFAATEEVDLSEMLGAFIGDSSGLNTVYMLPDGCDIFFEMEYDQYIRDQILENGRWTEAGRSAFSVVFYTLINDEKVVIFQAYANDVCLNTGSSIEEFGYVWVDLVCVEGVPNVKVREDVFLEAFYSYLGSPVYDDEAITAGVTTIVQALMEDSVITFEPDVIRITTANESVKDFFQVDELIGNITTQIGFKQRVTGIDELESTFAMFTVGELTDVSGTSPYTTELHQTITVYFDFGTYVEVVDMLVAYDEDSVAIVNGQKIYYPTLADRFMGTTRYYMVTITGDLSIYGIEIVSLTESYAEWEPTAETPTTARVDLDAAGVATTVYDAVYEVFGAYDRLLDGYVVANDYGYEIIYYEFEDGTSYYVVGMGEDYKGVLTSDTMSIVVGEEIPDEPQYDANGDPIDYRTDEDILRVLDMGDLVYFRDYVVTSDVTLHYDVASGYAGYYIVDSSINIIYNMIEDHYIIESSACLAEAQVVLASLGNITILYAEDSVNGDYNFAVGANVKGYDDEAEYLVSLYGVDVQYNNELGAYILDDPDYLIIMKAEVVNEISESTSAGSVIQYEEVMRYSLFIEDVADLAAVSAKYTSFTVTVDALLDWDIVKSTRTSFGTFDFAWVRWTEVLYDKVEWEDITINGGTYKVKVTIGGGAMMATYIEIMDVVIVNREIDTQDYVYVYTDSAESVLAPIVNTGSDEAITINAYLYALIKADYVNNQGYLSADFTEWFFEVYDIEFDFIDYYDGSEELETATVLGNFNWTFDYVDNTSNALYSESDISNILPESSSIVTYIYTEYLGQVVALAVTVEALTFDYLMFEGETEANTYTVDSLLEETYTIPSDPTFYFVEGGTINFSDLTAEGSSIFADMKWDVSEYFYTGDFGSDAEPVAENTIQRVAVIIWTNAVADNIKIAWGDEDVTPFLSSSSNQTATFIDIANFVDPNSDWIDTSRFRTYSIYITVDMPDKIVETVDYTDGDYSETTSKIYVDSTDADNLYVMQVDPYDYSTWQLPSTIGIWFVDGDSSYSKEYDVTWTGYESGYLTKTDIDTSGSGYFEVYCTIGNEDIGTIEIQMIVHQLSGVITSVDYQNENGDSLVVDSDFDTAPGVSYLVDTYERFDIPSMISVTFSDGNSRSYSLSDWGEFAAFAPGALVKGETSFGDTDYSYTQDLEVTFAIYSRTVEEIVVNKAKSDIADISINYTTQTISILVDSIYDSTNNYYVVGTKLNMYDYIVWLFSDLTVTLNDVGVKSTSYEVDMTDAVSQAIADIFATFDTQLALYDALTGQNGLDIIIYIGQGAGAVDYTVNIKLENGFALKEDTQIVYTSVYPYEFENNVAVAPYVDGFIFSEDLDVDVDFADENIADGDMDGIEEWVVGVPNGYTTVASTIDGINDGDVITSLSFETLLLGTGTLWISAMYDDSTRIYVCIEIKSEIIGSNYSADSDYYLDIKDGTITVDNYYNVSSYLANIANFLPQTIYLSGSKENAITNVKWTVDNAEYWADVVTYKGTGAATLVATAFVMNQTISLYLNILDSTIVGFSYEDSSDTTKNYESSGNTTDGITLAIDPYVNTGYGGEFTFGGNITFYLANGASADADSVNTSTYAVNSSAFSMADVLVTSNYVVYNYWGITNFKVQNSGSSALDVTVDLGATGSNAGEQDFSFNLSVVDRTLQEGANASSEGYDYVDGEAYTYNKGSVTLDPYSENLTVSTKPLLYFASEDVGELYYTITGWNETYEVKYNTESTIGDQTLTSTITFDGLTSQTVTIVLKVLDRTIEEWQLLGDDKETVYITDYIENYSNPKSVYVYEDPFAGLASDLPSYFYWSDDIYGGAAFSILDLEIEWIFEDTQIEADEDGVTNLLVTGYIKNSDVGQAITIRIYVYGWDFAAIRRWSNDDYYIMTDDVRFYFSTSTGTSSVEKYEISFNVYDTYTNGDTIIVNKEFIPEDLIEEGKESDYDYILYYQDSAKEKAKENAGVTATGTYYLGNAEVVTKVTMSANSANYEFEQIIITSIDLGYGDGATNEVIYVVNPLNLYFVEEADAWGTMNQENDVYLGTVTVSWSTTTFADSYLSGGLYVGCPVTLTLESQSDNGVSVTQSFKVYLIFLDMSPVTIADGGSAGDSAIQEVTYSNIDSSIEELTFNTDTKAYVTTTYYYTTDKVNYTANYGIGTQHPYGSNEVYNNIVSYLNDGVDYLLESNNRTVYSYQVTDWDGAVNTALYMNQTIYSKVVAINGTEYNTNMIKYIAIYKSEEDDTEVIISD